MKSDCHPLYESAAVRALDAAAIASGTSAQTLMRRAASAAWQAARQRWPEAKRVTVVCGSGNNGGDGYALALLARADGCQVQLVQVGSPPQRPEAQAMCAAWAEAGGEVQPWPAELDPEAALLVDAVFGIGLSRPVQGDAAEAIRAVNAHPSPVLALDLPSGLSADSGRPQGVAVEADLTISFIADKVGLWTGVACNYTGARQLAPLGLSPTAVEDLPVRAWRLPAGLTTARLPARQPAAHKGDHGHVLVVGGIPGMAGAALLAARAALRSGAGWVSLATHPDHAAALVSAQPEIMVHAVASPEQLQPLLRKARVVVLGPGLGLTAWSQGLHDAVLASGRPLLLDADALNLLARRPQSLGGAVLTPHPGEAARLLGVADAAVVEADRLGSVERLQARFGATVVLKGAGSLIADGRDLWVCAAGNPGMAVGGMGDVLSGVIGALMAQGLAPGPAACSGVLGHALAADQVAAARGMRGLLPSDVVETLPSVLNP